MTGTPQISNLLTDFNWLGAFCPSFVTHIVFQIGLYLDTPLQMSPD